MPKQYTKESLREEWERVSDSDNYQTGEYRYLLNSPVHDPMNYPESAYELDPEKVADWWLDKLSSLKQELLLEIGEDINHPDICEDCRNNLLEKQQMCDVGIRAKFIDQERARVRAIINKKL
jgi:hypothetical protein